jgi:hypothetical protein
MNNRTQQRFDKSIREASEAVKRSNAEKDRLYFAEMLPTLERRAGIIANMLETGQSKGKDLPVEILKQLADDLGRLNRRIEYYKRASQ